MGALYVYYVGRYAYVCVFWALGVSGTAFGNPFEKVGVNTGRGKLVTRCEFIPMPERVV